MTLPKVQKRLPILVVGQLMNSNLDNYVVLADLQAELTAVQAFGATTVTQGFIDSIALSKIEEYLDELEVRGMKMGIGFPESVPVQLGEGNWDFGALAAFLDTYQSHQALGYVQGYDEPFEELDVAQVTDLYSSFKVRWPEVTWTVQYSREVAKLEQIGPSGTGYTAGQCDVVRIANLVHRRKEGVTGYRRSDTMWNQSVSRAVIRRETPGIPLQISLQAFGKATGGRYAFPSVTAFEDALDLLLAHPDNSSDMRPDYIVVQRWSSEDAADDAAALTLKDPEGAGLRAILASYWT